MKIKGKTISDEQSIQAILGNYLQLKVAGNGLAAEGTHLDEESLAAFVEGNLREKESLPIVSHLVDCTFCRHVTSELVKLDFALADESTQVIAQNIDEPSPVSKVLNNILARIFGTNEGVVFAHHETEEDDDTADKEDSEEDK